MSKNNSKGNFTLRPNNGTTRSAKPSGGKPNGSSKPAETGTPNPNYTPPASVNK